MNKLRFLISNMTVKLKIQIKRIITNRFCFSRNNKVYLSGISSIEMILLLLVLVSVIVIFRTQITGIVNSVFKSIKESISDL